MAYTLNSVDLSTFGIIPGRQDGNISIKGSFNLPKRTGTTFKDWGEFDGIESFTDASEIFFEGRDITFDGNVFGTKAVVNNNLKNFYDSINNVTGTRTFATPYGNYNVIVNSVESFHVAGGVNIKVMLREPVADLTGGSLPGSSSSPYQIDGKPFSGYGLYVENRSGATNLAPLKDQNFTIFGSEGFQPVKRVGNSLKIDAHLFASSIADFNNKIKALYLCFKSSGERQIKINDELYVTCFADDGFDISNVRVATNGVFARFSINLRITIFSLIGF